MGCACQTVSSRLDEEKELDIIRATYHQPSHRGSLGGVQRFARTNRLPVKKVRQALERDVAYTLHKPVQRTFPTAPVMVMGMDHQWVADLVDMQNLSKSHRGIKYLLTVMDALSKYAWFKRIRDKSGQKMKQAWKKY